MMKILLLFLCFSACHGASLVQDGGYKIVASGDNAQVPGNHATGDTSHSGNMEHIVRGMMPEQPVGMSTMSNSSFCQCTGYTCGCCPHISWKKVHLDSTVCANFTYLPSPAYGISVTLTVNDHTVFNETISAQNPPPICAGIPYFEKYASLCVVFQNLSYSDKTLSGCVAVEARLEGLKVEQYQLGCFKLPPSHEQLQSDLQTDPTLHVPSEPKASSGSDAGVEHAAHQAGDLVKDLVKEHLSAAKQADVEAKVADVTANLKTNAAQLQRVPILLSEYQNPINEKAMKYALDNFDGDALNFEPSMNLKPNTDVDFKPNTDIDFKPVDIEPEIPFEFPW